MKSYRSYRCRGWASYDGPCGAPDCVSCNPGLNPGGWYSEDDDEDDEALAESEAEDPEYHQ